MSSEKSGQTEKDISIILAIRNEEEYIRKCLDSLVNQNFAAERYEIIVIDGMSNDKTREIVTEYQVKFPDLIRTFDNHKIKQASGRNVGIEHATGRIIAIFDGHAFTHCEYLNSIIKTFDSAPSDVVGVGGIFFSPEDETLFGKIMADVQGSIIGGALSFRHRTKNVYVHHVAFGAYKKYAIEKIGPYDERLNIGEDAEFSWRIIKEGFKLMVSPDIRIFYYRKYNSLKSFSVRMFRYALWKALVSKKHPGSFKIWYAIPSLVLLSVILLPIFIFFSSILAAVTTTGLIIYLSIITILSLHLARKHRDIRYLISFPIYIIQYFSIGAGFLVGVFRSIPKKEPH